MSKTTKRLMRNFKWRLGRYVDLEIRHCGHELEMRKAVDAHARLVGWLEGEIENLVMAQGGGR